jgi:hypothetical protein
MSSLAGVPSRKCLAMNIPSMPGVYDLAYRFAAALGIGLLIGAERERRKGGGALALPGRYPDLHDCFSVRRSELRIAGLTTNTVTKMVVAISSGGRRFALQIIPGLILVVLGVWFGTIFSLFR